MDCGGGIRVQGRNKHEHGVCADIGCPMRNRLGSHELSNDKNNVSSRCCDGKAQLRHSLSIPLAAILVLPLPRVLIPLPRHSDNQTPWSTPFRQTCHDAIEDKTTSLAESASPLSDLKTFVQHFLPSPDPTVQHPLWVQARSMREIPAPPVTIRGDQTTITTHRTIVLTACASLLHDTLLWGLSKEAVVITMPSPCAGFAAPPSLTPPI
ncbi:hypothetical protein IWZ01DRAFT_366369 [Phyllosticta capitalensis]